MHKQSSEFFLQLPLPSSPDSPCLATPESAAFLPPVTCSKAHISQALRGTAPCQARDKVT